MNMKTKLSIPRNIKLRVIKTLYYGDNNAISITYGNTYNEYEQAIIANGYIYIGSYDARSGGIHTHPEMSGYIETLKRTLNGLKYYENYQHMRCFYDAIKEYGYHLFKDIFDEIDNNNEGKHK